MLQLVHKVANSERLTKLLSAVLGVVFVLALFVLPTHHKVMMGPY